MTKANDIPGLTAEDMAKLQSVFDPETNVDEVILYGSRAKGTYRNGSDIDLTVKGHDLTHDWLLRTSLKIDDLLLPWEVDLSIYDNISNSDLIDHINRVGKVVFCQ